MLIMIDIGANNNTEMRDYMIQKVEDRIIRKQNLNSFSVIGDPGCEGLGTVMMQTYASALVESDKYDMILVVGDMVPIGDKAHYKSISDITNAIAKKEVYTLRGNHDTGNYTDEFGLHNYAIISDKFTIVVIDNAFREFDEEGLELLKEILPKEECENIIIAFHIPLPNHFTPNCVSDDEFERLKEVYTPYKDKIKYFVCGHVHSRFEDTVDGIPFICTGGGGARIEDVSENIKASDINHHIVEFKFTDGKLNYKIIDLTDDIYSREISDSIIRDKLMETVQGELMAHLRYLTFADRAQNRGYEDIANLFSALAESEYRHARNFFALIDRPADFEDAIATFIPTEVFEYEKLYKMMREYANENEFILTRSAYHAAARAEKIHAKLLKSATDMDNFAVKKLYVCPICGYIMEESDEYDRCPVCGAPERDFIEFIPKQD